MTHNYPLEFGIGGQYLVILVYLVVGCLLTSFQRSVKVIVNQI
jgi:hypothetical protein